MDMSGQKAEIVIVDEEMKKSAAIKAINTTGKYPLLETADGCIQESSAIAKYFCALSGKFLGSNDIERTQVDQWISFASKSAETHYTVLKGIFGWGDVTQGDWNDAAKAVKADFKIINTSLEGKQWLAGDSISVADVVVASIYSLSLRTILDGGFRKAMKNASDWAERVFDHPSVIKVMGKQLLCAKALKPICKEEKKEEKKKAAPAPVKKEAKPEKKLDNVESLPPTAFNLYDFKTFYVNHPDKKGAAVDEWYKMLDWEGWAFWHLHYDKYEGEGEKLHVTNNLLGGFLSRAEHTNKYCFGRMGVFGEEPDLEIKGVWLMRGLELPDGLAKEHPQFEYYNTRKLDPRNNKDDDKLVRDYFSGLEE